MNGRPQFRIAPGLFFFVFFLILPAATTLAQQVQTTRILPANITLRGISMADFYHSMCVGDSATILINLDSGTRYVYGDFVSTYRTWTQLVSPVSRSHTLYGVSYYDSLHAIVIGDAGLILHTSDNGINWTHSADGLTYATLRGIVQVFAGSFVIVGDSGIILRSVDAGMSWNRVASGTTDTLFAVTFGSDRVGIAVGEKGTAIKTTDGGLSWRPVVGLVDPKINFYALAMSGEDSAIVVGDSSRIHYINDGINWKTARQEYQIASNGLANMYALGPLRAVAYTGAQPDTNHPWAFGMGSSDLSDILFGRATERYNGQLRRTDTLWSADRVTYIGDADGTVDTEAARFNCIAVNHSGPYILVQVAGANGNIQQSVDTLHTLNHPSSPLTDGGLVALATSFDGTGYGFAVSSGGSIFRSSNNGLYWNIVFEDTKRLISGVHCFDSNTAVVAGWNGYIYRTSDGGRRWITEPNTVVQYKLHSFAFPTHDVGICVGDQGTILRTSDAGITWNDVGDHVTGAFLNRVAFSTPMIGVVVGQFGTIRRTTDGGLSWPPSGSPATPFDFSNANLKYIDAFPDGTYIIGADSGVIRSTDQGVNWYYIAVPPCAIGSSFYNSKIGIVGEYTTSSVAVPDTMVLKSTTDGGTSWSNSFKVPIINANRLVTHWLDSHTFLLYGTDGFIVKVDLSGPNVVTQVISSAASPLRAYPNPNHGSRITIEYTVEKEGPVSIKLTDDLGRNVSTLYSGTETVGDHSRTVTLPSELQGSYIVTLEANGKQQTLKVVKF